MNLSSNTKYFHNNPHKSERVLEVEVHQWIRLKMEKNSGGKKPVA